MRLLPTDLLSVVADLLTIAVTGAAIVGYVLRRVGAQRLAVWLSAVAVFGFFPALLAFGLRAFYFHVGLDLLNGILLAFLCIGEGLLVSTRLTARKRT